MPFINRLTIGNCPNGVEEFMSSCKMDDSMLLAVFMVLYDDPFSYSIDRKSRAMGRDGDKTSQCFCLQNSSHFWRYVWYCAVVPFRQDAIMTSEDLDVKPRSLSCFLIVDK